MQEVLNGFAIGFGAVLNIKILLLLILGGAIGTLTGAMPGLGPSSSIALLLPMAISMSNAQEGLALLVSVYLGCMFGGRITAITLNIPGDAPAIVTAWDGYPMMRQGRGGVAMSISALTSAFGGLVSFLLLAAFAPALAKVALNFSAPENFSIMLFGFAMVVGLAEKKVLKSLISLSLGILIAMIGADQITGLGRYVFTMELYEGIEFTIVVLGAYGIGEVLSTVEEASKIDFAGKELKLNRMFPTWKEIKSCIGSAIRGTTIGTLIGMLPGAGGTIATFLTYSVEKSVSKNPDEFGKGCIQGVAAPEAANNASVGGAMVPMLALGIPGSGTTAMLLGALTMFGLQAGPRIFTTSTEVVWTMIVGLIVANIFLFIVNTLLIPLFIKGIQIGQEYLSPIICVICCIGVFAITYGTWHIRLVILFGLLGYLFKKFGYPTGPFILALVLAKMCEVSFRQALIMGRGNYSIFITRPISMVFILLTVFSLFLPLIRKRIKALKQEKK